MRAYRLLRAADFSRAFAGATRRSDRYFTVLACPNSLGHDRLGLAIAKKQLRRAVDRNRVKRLVREYFRREVQPAGTGFDFVVMARAAARGADNRRLFASLAQLFGALRK